MITSTICVIVLLLAITIFLRYNHTHVKDFGEMFQGLVTACLKELRFEGGRAANANLILSAILAILFVLMCLHTVPEEVRKLLGGEGANVMYILFIVLVLFFSLSMCFIFASDRYSKKMGN